MSHDSSHEPSANDVRRTVRRFEEMLATSATVFFDLSDFELLIDHYTGQQDYPHALRACEMALEQYPFSADLLIDKAQILAMLSRTTEALRLIDEVAELEPNNPDVAVTRGIIYSQRSEFGRAVEFFEQGLAQSGDDHGRDDVEFNLGLAYQHWGKPRAAARHYQQSLKLNPANESAAHELLQCWALSDELGNAPAFFQTFVDTDPFSARAWFNLGLAHFRLENNDDAHDAFEYATFTDADFHAAFGYLGQTLVLRGDYRSALDAFDQSFPTGQPTAEALCNLGECHEKLQEWTEAKRYYQRALELDPETDEAWFGLGMVLAGQERWFEALHYMRKALSLYDESGEYWLGLARCEYLVGNIVSALDAYEHATAADPASAEAWVGWASVLFEQGHHEEAADLVKTALETAPDDAELNYRAAAYLLAAGRYREAYTYLENALLLDFDKHPMLFEYLPALASQPTLLRLIDQYRK
jgi:tetratricopeptide (TPR) repeat protein